jgi:outer membrane protein insertion porin family
LFFRVDFSKKTDNQGNVNLTFDLYEGDIVRIGKVFITGNNKVATEKIIKMIDLKTGDLFSRSKLNTSQRKIADSGLFDPEKLTPNIIPHIEDKTLDIEFQVQER